MNKALEDKNLYLWLLLTLTPKVGIVTIKKLIHHFGSIDNIYNQSQATLSQIVSSTVASLINSKVSTPEADNALKWMNEHDNNLIISIDNPLYPVELANIADPPNILFLKGNVELLKQNKFAVVGTRHPSTQGSNNALAFAKDLSNNGLVIVSGMASGIDRAAHLGALEGSSRTIGVIGTGIDQIYPLSNKDLYQKVLEQDGLLISEFPLQTPPLINNFPRRNRIIAGLSLGLLVVESALDGGSMVSANMALEMGREVMAIPGSIHSPVSRGCHKLIKTGAKLIETSNDILEDLRITPTTMAYNPVSEQNPILDIMGFEPITIDKICSDLNIEFNDLCANLLELELNGKITNCGGGRYQRVFR
jgi:DNA processing protein